MQNQDEGPRYTDPGHPCRNSDGRSQSQYTNGQNANTGKPFQFPWWAIVIPFCVGLWPVGIAFIVMNAMMKEGKPSEFEAKAREKAEQLHRTSHTTAAPDGRTVYEAEFHPVNESKTAENTAANSDCIYTQAVPPVQKAVVRKKQGKKEGAALALTVAGIALLATAMIALSEGVYWLPDALTEGGYYWRWLLEDTMPALIAAAGGAGCLFGAHKLRTGKRLRKKIANIVGDAPYMYIEDIAAAIPCSYEKCCKHLENCIDAEVFGPEAYLDMNRRCLVVTGKAPEKQQRRAAAETFGNVPKEPDQTKDEYQKILDELRCVNDAIPDAEMSDKISRLETVAAKIFEQAKSDPDKLPRMRKFMDYYLPTSLKLLQAYAELDAQGVEGVNITESKRRIEQTMDTLVHAFETQLDQLFAADALDISTDIDVMQNMMRADGLTDDTPFQTK